MWCGGGRETEYSHLMVLKTILQRLPGDGNCSGVQEVAVERPCDEPLGIQQGPNEIGGMEGLRDGWNENGSVSSGSF